MTGAALALALVAVAAVAGALAVPRGAGRSGAGTGAGAVRVWLRALHSDWSPTTLVAACIGAAVGTALIGWLLAGGGAAGMVLGAVAGPTGIWLRLRAGQRRYRAGFRRQFLPALEIIVRGLRSGMPLLPALQVVQKEVSGPVQAEFRRLLDDLSLGLPLPQAVERMAERLPLTEVQFFAAVIALQARTGGRLSEALENLAGTLRGRDLLDQRIRTVSQEARTSALIIGVLPLFVMLGLFLLNPDYIMPLFVHPLGQAVLAGSALWMGCGVWIMKRMTVIDV